MYKRATLFALVTLALTVGSVNAQAGNRVEGYIQTNLVSDVASEHPSQPLDSDLMNPWGIAFFPGGPVWINDNVTGLATLYTGTGVKQGLKVTIPPPSNAPQGTIASPDGIVWNGNPLAFKITGNSITAPALFIFATEDGTISAWNGNSGTTAQLVKDETDPNHGAVYKGLALGVSATKGILLYATNFRSGHVDVFDATFKPVTTLSGHFTDPNIPATFAPFGIANINGDLFVSYAMQNSSKHDDVAGKGNGFVDIFDTDGNLIRRFGAGGPLNSPWGMVASSFNFGKFNDDILIGNFGDGTINVYAKNGDFLDKIEDASENVITIDDLWGLSFGGAAGASPDVLYFTAGVNDEKDGIFGTITPVPQPQP